MSIRQIRNETFYVHIGEEINLPSELAIVEGNVQIGTISVPSSAWRPTSTVDTSKPADLVYTCRIDGYPEDVVVSVIIDGIDGVRCFSIST